MKETLLGDYVSPSLSFKSSLSKSENIPAWDTVFFFFFFPLTGEAAGLVETPLYSLYILA